MKAATYGPSTLRPQSDILAKHSHSNPRGFLEKQRPPQAVGCHWRLVSEIEPESGETGPNALAPTDTELRAISP